MKRLSIFIAAFSFLSFNEAPVVFNAKNVERSFAKIKSGLYLNKYEVSNSDYLLYLSSLSQNISAYKAAYPDTAVWAKIRPFASFYLTHTAYTNYPLVGVSYENALRYCQWLTDTYNADGTRKYNKVIFRLPTREEWTLAANGGDSKKQYPWGTGFIRNNRGMALCNFQEDYILQKNKKGKYEEAKDPVVVIRTKITSPVKSFFPSSYGMYSMSGNVAEMISEKGVAKGGSYSDPAWGVTIASETKYVSTAANIGFRVAMEVIEK